jgi:probable phosphoglycerate mutase
VLARHGRTAWNAEGRFQGHSDTPLDPTGRQQALELAARLAPLRPGLVIASDLQRARSTAETVAEASGVPMAIDPDLREVYLGGWEGLNREEASARFPDEYQAWSSGQSVRRGGGETEGEAGRRAAAAIGRAMGDQPGLVVVVSHGLVLQSAIGFLALDGLIRDGAGALHLGNGEYVAYADDGDPWQSLTTDEVPGTL